MAAGNRPGCLYQKPALARKNNILMDSNILTMKKLVIIAHPHMDESNVHRAWKEELLKLDAPDITVHDIYEAYPDGKIDVASEQRLVEAHDCIIFQFPVYWYSSPALLKQWEDDVLAQGWAYPGKYALEGKSITCAVSAAGGAEDYSKHGKAGHTIEEVLLPYRLTASFIHANYLPSFAWYNAEGISPEHLKASLPAYISFIKSM